MAMAMSALRVTTRMACSAKRTTKCKGREPAIRVGRMLKPELEMELEMELVLEVGRRRAGQASGLWAGVPD